MNNVTFAPPNRVTVAREGGSLPDKYLWGKSLIVALGAILLVLVCATMTQTARAQAGPCDSVMKKMLSDRGVPTRDTKSIEYDVSTGANGTGPIHMGWVRLNSCHGYVVNQTTEYCMVMQQYSLGACEDRGTVESRIPNGNG